MNKLFNKDDVKKRAKEILHDDFEYATDTPVCLDFLEDAMKLDSLNEAAMVLVDDTLYHMRYYEWV